MTAEELARYVAEKLPEFRDAVEDHLEWNDGEVLAIILLGHLAQLYAERQPVRPELAQRFWDVMEHLVEAEGGIGESAVHQGLVEFLAWGDEHEMGALLDAEPFQGPQTRRIVGYYMADWPDGTRSGLRLLADERAGRGSPNQPR